MNKTDVPARGTCTVEGKQTPSKSTHSLVVINALRERHASGVQGNLFSSGEVKAFLRNHMGSYGSIFKVGGGEDNVALFTLGDLWRWNCRGPRVQRKCICTSVAGVHQKSPVLPQSSSLNVSITLWFENND